MSSPSLPRAVEEVLERTRRAAVAYGRPDLVARVEAAVGRGSTLPVVVLVGEHKQGRSTLADALIGRPVLPTAVDEDASVAVVIDPVGGPAAHGVPVDVDEASVPLLDDEVAEAAVQGVALDVDLSHVVVQPATGRPQGLVLVDTPATSGWSTVAGAQAAGWLPTALVGLVVHDAGQPLTASELDLVRLAARLCPVAGVVLTRIDLHAAWRQVAELVGGQLDEAGLAGVAVLATSARRAIAGDAPEHTGLGVLERWLDDIALLASAGTLGARTCIDVADALLAGFDDELADLDAAGAGDDPALPPPAAIPWTTVLGDGLSDLADAVDASVGRRQRRLLRELDERLEASDPARCWDEITAWLRAEASRGAVVAFDEVQHDAVEVARRVAAAVPMDPDVLVAAVTGGAGLGDRLDDLTLADRLETGRRIVGVGARGLGALKATYSGMLLAGMLTGLAGVTLAAPALVVAGAVLGSKTIRDERTKQLTQRRQQARTAAKRYLDDAFGVVDAELRELVRVVQRDLRDAAAVAADEHERRRAQQVRAAAADAQARAQRRVELDAERRRVVTLRQQAEAALGSVVGSRA